MKTDKCFNGNQLIKTNCLKMSFGKETSGNGKGGEWKLAGWFGGAKKKELSGKNTAPSRHIESFTTIIKQHTFYICTSGTPLEASCGTLNVFF